eukprot:6666026-Prymnesium_polylepis.2
MRRPLARHIVCVDPPLPVGVDNFESAGATVAEPAARVHGALAIVVGALAVRGARLKVPHVHRAVG